jgi:transposase-like protein
MERMLEAEMSAHLGYELNEVEGRGSGNSRNGHSAKTIQTETGPVVYKSSISPTPGPRGDGGSAG